MPDTPGAAGAVAPRAAWFDPSHTMNAESTHSWRPSRASAALSP